MRWRRWMALGALALVAAGVYAAPGPIKAWACPACYGLERVAPGWIAEPDVRGLPDLARARMTVAAALDLPADWTAPTILLCQTAACAERLDGTPRLGLSFGTRLIYLAPWFDRQVILTHELLHAGVAGQVGLRAMLTEAALSWFNEGLAVLVSADPRYLPAPTGQADACGPVRDDLPLTNAAWGRAIAEQGPVLYHDAACAVQH